MRRIPVPAFPLAVLALGVLLLCAPGARADDRKMYTDAKAELEHAYFDELDPKERNRLFEAYGRWDNREVVKPLGDIIALYGTYMLALEAKLASYQERIRPFVKRVGLKDEEVGLRNSLQRKIDQAEKDQQSAQQSLELLGRVVGGYQDEKTIQYALTLFEKNGTWHVRWVLAAACAHWHKFLHNESTSKKAVDSLRKLFADEEPRVRVEVMRSMGHFRTSESLIILKQGLADKDWRVRSQAVRAVGQHKTPEALTLLVETMKGEKGRLVDDLNKILQTITGKNFQYVEQWVGWWKAQDGKIPPREAKETDRRPDGKAPVKKKADARFYGIPTSSDKICYIIDVSGSMKKEVDEWKQVTITGRKETEQAVQGKTRIEVAKNELKRAILNLNSQKRFTIIFFSSKVDAWREKPVFASRDNKMQATKDTEAQVAAGATWTLGALREAFTIAGALGGGAARTGSDGAGIDTIFLLSDGGPTDNSMDDAKPMPPEVILEQVKRWNKDAGIIIHTIAVHCDEVGTHFLKSLAAQNGGMFVERKNPTKKKK